MVSCIWWIAAAAARDVPAELTAWRDAAQVVVLAEPTHYGEGVELKAPPCPEPDNAWVVPWRVVRTLKGDAPATLSVTASDAEVWAQRTAAACASPKAHIASDWRPVVRAAASAQDGPRVLFLRPPDPSGPLSGVWRALGTLDAHWADAVAGSGLPEAVPLPTPSLRDGACLQREGTVAVVDVVGPPLQRLVLAWSSLPPTHAAAGAPVTIEVQSWHYRVREVLWGSAPEEIQAIPDVIAMDILRMGDLLDGAPYEGGAVWHRYPPPSAPHRHGARLVVEMYAPAKPAPTDDGRVAHALDFTSDLWKVSASYPIAHRMALRPCPP